MFHKFDGRRLAQSWRRSSAEPTVAAASPPPWSWIIRIIIVIIIMIIIIFIMTVTIVITISSVAMLVKGLVVFNDFSFVVQ